MGHKFLDDYSESAHPEIVSAIPVGGNKQFATYGNDELCDLAAKRILARFGLSSSGAHVHFIGGATHANLVMLAAFLRPHQGVIAPNTGHINTHEAGSIEATGHKIIHVESPDGKLTVELLNAALAFSEDEHTVQPKVLYLTQATEEGSTYTADEFTALIAHAKSHNLYVMVDGARLAMALASEHSNMTPEWFGTSGIDAFVVGGTKVGGLSGEAIVIVNPELQTDFRYHLKQRGGLLAKAFFIGAQFARFFDADDLWLTLGQESNSRAQLLAQQLINAGVELATQPTMNQVFAYMTDEVIDELNKQWGFYRWRKMPDGRWMVRLTCSWATPTDQIEEFGKSLRLI